MTESKILIGLEDAAEAIKLNKSFVSQGYEFHVVCPYLKSTFRDVKDFKPDLIMIDIFLKGNGAEDMIAKTCNYRNIPILYFNPNFPDETLQMLNLADSTNIMSLPTPLDMNYIIEVALSNHQLQDVIGDGEKNYRMLIENAEDPIALINYDGLFLLLNSSAAKYLGGKTSDFLGKRMNDLFPAEYANHQMKVIRGVIDSGKGYRMEEKTVIQGKERWFSVNIQPIFSHDGSRSTVQLIARDITQNKEREDFFFGTLNDMHTFVAVLKPTGEIVFINNTPLKLIKKELKDVKGKKFYDSKWWNYSDESRKRIKEDIKSCAQGSIINHETQIFTDEGLIWIDHSMHPFYDEQGNIKYLVPEGRDITSKKEAEKALHAERNRLKMLNENSPFGIVLIDSKGDYQYINPKFEELFGYTLKEIPNGKAWFRKAFPNRKARFKAISTWLNDFKYAKTGASKFRTFLVTCKDGTQKSIHFIPVLLETGEYLMTVRDVTRQIKADKAIKESEERFRTVAHSALDAIIITNKDAEIIYSNESLHRIFGFSQGEVIGKSIIFLISRNCKDEFHRNTYRFKLTGSPQISGRIFESNGLRSDGSEFPIEVSITNWQVGGEIYITFIIRDITERKLVDYELEKSRQRFQQMADHIDEVFWIMDVHMNQILYISPSYSEIWGRSRESLFDNPRFWIESIHPEDRREIVENIFRSPHEIRTDTNEGHEYRIIRPDGSIRWIHSHIYPIFNDKNKVYRTAGTARDITELKIAQEKYLNLTQNIELGIYRSSFVSDRFMEVNPFLLKMLKYDENEIFSINCIDLYRDPVDRLKMNEELLKKGFFKNKRVELKTKNGNILNVILSEVAVKESKGKIKYCDGIIEKVPVENLIFHKK